MGFDIPRSLPDQGFDGEADKDHGDKSRLNGARS
jgi:hypothetical protein